MADVDLLVIGGGAAGLGAARAGAWEGASVLLVSDGPLGGDCTFTGCIPSKALIEGSRRAWTFEQSLSHVHKVVSDIAATENEEVLRAQGVDVRRGRATFVGPRTVSLDQTSVSARRIVVATGSHPMLPPIEGIETVGALTNTSFFALREQPTSMVIVGGGPIGCELAEALARFGTKVTIIEAGPRLLNRYEPEASTAVEQGLAGLGVRVLLSSTVKTATSAAGGGAIVVTAARERIGSSHLLLAVGRRPNTKGLGLGAAGIETDAAGWIATDRFLRTTAKGVYAAGDVNGKHLLSSAADEMGRSAAWSALRRGRRYPYDPGRVPQVVFTTPEVASIGVLEADAPSNARVAELPMSANDRAVAAGRTAGFVRLIAKPDLLTRHKAGGRLIGATIVGDHAGELINEAALSMRSGSLAGRLAQTMRAYPSWSTIMQKTASLWFFDYEGHSARAPRR